MHKSGPAGSTLQILTFYTLMLQTLTEATARVCQTLTEVDGTSLNRQRIKLD